MALPDNNINTVLVATYIGLPSNKVSELVGVSGLNKFSRYAPGTLGVDANKNITLTPPTSGYKEGDYRRYNHTELGPHFVAPPSGYIGWGPSGSTATCVLSITMEELNLAAFPNNGIDFTTIPAHYHLRVDVYTQSQYRLAASNLLLGAYPIDKNMVAHTPLTGHTRQVNWVMNTGASGNLLTISGIPVDAPECTRYFEVYFCDIAGNRLINFGADLSAGYIDIVFKQYQAPSVIAGPYFTNSGTYPVTNPPTWYDTINARWVSWTAAWPVVSSETTPCTSVAPIIQQGSPAFTFYVKTKGITGTPYHMPGITSCNIHMIVTMADGTTFDQTLATGVAITEGTSGYYCNGILAAGRTWQYGWQGKVVLSDVVWSGNKFYCAT